MIYPEKSDPDYAKKLVSMEEYQMYKIPPLDIFESEENFLDKTKEYCIGFEKTQYQHLMQHYLSRRSPYRSLLLYHGLGIGKTCSAVTIAESLLLDHTHNEKPRIIVISSEALKNSFIDNLDNQCTGDLYKTLVHGEVLEKKIKKIIKKRYAFYTYDGLKNIAKDFGVLKNKVIIIDEVHNLRDSDKKKDAAIALEKIIESGENNRLVMLTATPMYNDPEEIMVLLKLLVLNEEHRVLEDTKLYNKAGKLSDSTRKILEDLSSKYISYINGSNPFTLAARLSPKLSKVEIIDKPWAKNISDGIVQTICGSKQKIEKYGNGIRGEIKIEDMEIDLDNNNNGLSIASQYLNITYPNQKRGEEGIKELFNETDEIIPVQFAYRDTKEALHGANLKNCAAKIAKILDFIKSSEGIVIVFSRFVTSGAIPLAIALEHLGFNRYGVRNLLNRRNVLESIDVGTPTPSYCIITGNPKYMGNIKIEKILSTVNGSNNMHGEKVKVVILTPIASEGLNFKNIREIHIMDPWYHFNRIDQVIGRGIRTCSHINLPLEERNVTVYLHAAVKSTSDDKSADIHAYKIAAEKLDKTREIERIIRNSALDCSLLKNVNYYPKSLFKFVATMRTSQKTQITYNFGSDPSYEPICKNEGQVGDQAAASFTMREDLFLDMMPTLLQRLKKYLLKNKETVYFTPEQIAKDLKLDIKLVYYTLKNAIYPNELISGYKLYPHLGNIVIVKDEQEIVATKLKIIDEEIKLPDFESSSEIKSNCDILNIIETIDIKKDLVRNQKLAIIKLYKAINSECWSDIAKDIIRRITSSANSTIKNVADLLWKQGALVKDYEIKKDPKIGNDLYIGYCDIFNTTDIEIYINENESGKYREAKKNELDNLKKNRVEMKLTGEYGIIAPIQRAKEPNSPFINEFKISGKGKGTVCGTKKIPELSKILLNLNPAEKRILNKNQLCEVITEEMMKQNKLLFYPVYKPVVS